MEKLDCNLVIMKKKSRPKVLRLNLNGSSFKLHEPQVSFPWPLGVDDEGPPPPTYFDCRDDNNTTLRAPSVTPTSTPDHEIFSLTITDLGSSISSSEPGASPFLANIRKNSLFIADESDSGLDHESEFPSFNSTRKSVREAISLPRNVPPHGSPALCTVCQHKAPGFGNPPKWFTYEELEVATNGFSKENFLAEGGFGSVYRGELPDGQVVAVKQHKSVSSQGDVEFCSEVEVLSCAQHRNVVMLIGFCIENARRLLVYEYVCNGSLDSHLFGLDRDALTWHARQRIAVGAARGLRYLHEECRVGCIVHRDMRPNNILLTHDFEPLVGDFGLARWQPHADLGVSTRIIGTFGYLAPEYVQSGQITEKADVYAFGVVLLELITGRKAIDVLKPKGQQCLTEWARPLLEKNRVDELVDPRVSKRYLVVQQLSNMMFCASLCLKRDPDSRPRMSQVLRILEGDLLMNSPTGNQTT
ncbi:Inactive protein kinase SELMODRAFT_444075 [Linum grandiflorum]